MANRRRCATMIANRNSKSDSEGASSIIVDVLNKSKNHSLTAYRLKRLTDKTLKTVLNEHDIRDAEVSVLFVDDGDMAELNLRHRKVEGPTDVLSFPLHENSGRGVMPSILGDIVISVETAERQAAETGQSLQREVACLLIHGLLHLLGYDHETGKKEAAEMRRLEETYRGIVSIEASLAS
jgi:probable rRNA maturation factor